MQTRKMMIGAGERRNVTTCTTHLGRSELKTLRGWSTAGWARLRVRYQTPASVVASIQATKR